MAASAQSTKAAAVEADVETDVSTTNPLLAVSRLAPSLYASDRRRMKDLDIMRQQCGSAELDGGRPPATAVE